MPDPIIIDEPQERYMETMKRLERENQVLRELMMITAEECGELTQVCCKVLRRDELNNEWKEKLIEEIGDLQCMINLLIEHTILTKEQIDARVDVKRNKLKKWSTLINET
jgi:NTP pyrophosphatase (non-canonical NTP hydrolase)